VKQHQVSRRLHRIILRQRPLLVQALPSLVQAAAQARARVTPHPARRFRHHLLNLIVLQPLQAHVLLRLRLHPNQAQRRLRRRLTRRVLRVAPLHSAPLHSAPLHQVRLVKLHRIPVRPGV